jgi:CrcB protein
MSGFLYVALGGAIGASARHGLGHVLAGQSTGGFPVATFLANVGGGFLMGVLAAFLALKIDGGESLRLFLGVGILGGFTTFSAFSLESILLFERKAYGLMTLYVGGSVILSLCALAFGLMLGRVMFAS